MAVRRRLPPGTLLALAASAALGGCGGGGNAATTGLAPPGAAAPTSTDGLPPATSTVPPAGTDGETSPAPTPATPTEATVPDADRPLLCPADADASDAFDARELEGTRLEEARRAAAAHGCSVRVARRDGEDLVLTQDLSRSRINVEVTDGRVVRALSVG